MTFELLKALQIVVCSLLRELFSLLLIHVLDFLLGRLILLLLFCQLLVELSHLRSSELDVLSSLEEQQELGSKEAGVVLLRIWIVHVTRSQTLKIHKIASLISTSDSLYFD